MARSPAMAPTTLGGGATTYDVSPPAATTEATAAGVALANKTFGSFTGADAGSIDGYTARTVNAVGLTAWSGSGLGAYTPSGGADGDAGVLALDATIGGVVVATALHDYSRAAAAGGKAWSTVESTDFTGTSTGALSNGSNTIDGKSWDVTLNSATATDDANGIRVVKSTSGFCYIGRDVAAVLTDKEAPFRVVFALDDISIANAGNVGVGVFSGTTPDAATRAPSVQHRVNNASGTYNRQPLHTTGAVGGSPAYTNPGNQALAGAPTSCVLEVYGFGSLVAVRWYDGTTTIPAASDPTDVFTSTSWRIMSLATGGATAGSNPNFWNNLWASMVIGSGSAVAVSADILDYQLDEWS